MSSVISINNGFNSLEFASIGQQKISYLSLLFAYIDLFRYKFSSYPVVLIDDMSSELDDKRWHMLIKYIRKRDFQVFLTTANSYFKEKLYKIRNVKRFNIT